MEESSIDDAEKLRASEEGTGGSNGRERERN